MKELLLKLQKNLRLISKNDQQKFQTYLWKFNNNKNFSQQDLLNLKRIEEIVDFKLVEHFKYTENYKKSEELQIEFVEKK